MPEFWQSPCHRVLDLTKQTSQCGCKFFNTSFCSVNLKAFHDNNGYVHLQRKHIFTSSGHKLKWVDLERRRFYHRCIHIYKCVNGLTQHSLDIVKKSEIHSYNTRNKDTLKLPKVRRNWGKQ